MENKPMTVLLVEDDNNEWNKFKNIEEKRNDILFVKMTNSADEGLKYVEEYVPEAVILDLELTNGSGSGFEFIKGLEELNISIRPKIVVTTNVCSDMIYDFLHKNGVDFIFYKKQSNYSNENVINTLVLLRDCNETNSLKEDNTLKLDIDKKISDKINEELDLIGVGTHLQGRKYLYNAILYLINDDGEAKRPTVIQYLTNMYKRSNSTISRAMQNAIYHAWRISSIEELSAHYTARVNYETGIPTPTEFIYYYADKIKKSI